jgi:hypothetical protein
MQDLSNAVPTTHEQDEEFKQMENIGLKEMFAGMGSDLTGGKSNTFDAPTPQPTLTDIINNICTQLQLLTSVISSFEEKSSSTQSLQECVSLTLQQADWFKEMVRGIVDDTYDFADYAKDAVQDVVENEVESYFENSFDPTYHFDFDDAVSDAVDDRIDGIVSDKIDDAVESYMSGATITISK